MWCRKSHPTQKQEQRMSTATLEKPHCPKCNSTRVYFRRTTQDFVCQTCGHDWPRPAAAK